ncbi:hypothetical protein LTR97_001750 [Elasticomyces elasticus]|uniref:Heterokaryon incompatibility domain-containing protein n=1 Tax=Elasticomyces elasticus TaxID=574655 RepID=A0AAN7WGI8_9PEZI|nr:hypothetical protein LTR97_001750 [Elasticomyces elasticus]
MSQIYAGSSGNLVHLGDLDDRVLAKRIAVSINALAMDAESSTDGFKSFASAISDPVTETKPLRCSFDPQALSAVLELPWWRRLWTLQEAALAPWNTAFLGALSFDLLDISRSIIWWRAPARGELMSSAARMGLFCLIESYNWSNRGQGWLVGGHDRLDHLLVGARAFQKSEPKDGVFALLALLANSPPVLTLDYSRPLSEILQNATRCAISGMRDQSDKFALDIFQHISHHEGDLERSDVASWVIRADTERDHQVLDAWQLPSQYWIHIPQPYRIVTKDVHMANNVLQVEGYLVDEVLNVSSVCSVEHLDYGKFVAWLEETLEIAAQQSFADLFRTIAVGLCEWDGDYFERRDNPGHSGPRSPSTNMLVSTKLSASSPASPAPAHWEALSQDRWKRMMHRRFLLTSRGCPGMGPRVTKPGDVVAILHGASRPYILRPLDNGQYQLVGEAYVDGLMRDEKIEKYLEPQPVVIALV